MKAQRTHQETYTQYVSLVSSPRSLFDSENGLQTDSERNNSRDKMAGAN